MRTKSVGKKKINVVTLGCSKNVYDSEVLMGQLEASGKNVVHEEKGDVVVINTCGFIDNAKEESINTILEYVDLKNQGIVEKVFVTGCLSERYKPDLEREIPDVDQYFGTTDLPDGRTIGNRCFSVPLFAVPSSPCRHGPRGSLSGFLKRPACTSVRSIKFRVSAHRLRCIA